MGCDIHLHIELKVDGEWQHWATPRVTRNYEVFAKMAGVRALDDEITPISRPRGLPADVSLMTRAHADYWERQGPGHNHSWLAKKELKELAEWGQTREWGQDGFWFEREFGYLFGACLYDELPEFVEDLRAVFWFDC